MSDAASSLTFPDPCFTSGLIMTVESHNVGDDCSKVGIWWC